MNSHIQPGERLISTHLRHEVLGRGARALPAAPHLDLPAPSMASVTRALPTGGGQKSTAMVKDSLDSAQRRAGAALGVEASFGRVPIRARVVLCNVVDPGRSFAGGARVCTPGGARSFYTLRTSPQTIKASAACRTAEHSGPFARSRYDRTHQDPHRWPTKSAQKDGMPTLMRRWPTEAAASLRGPLHLDRHRRAAVTPPLAFTCAVASPVRRRRLRRHLGHAACAHRARLAELVRPERGHERPASPRGDHMHRQDHHRTAICVRRTRTGASDGHTREGRAGRQAHKRGNK